MKQHDLLDKIITEDRLNKILNAITGINSDGTVRGITTVESDSSIEIIRRWRGFRFVLLFFASVTLFFTVIILLELLMPQDFEFETSGSDPVHALIFLLPISLGFTYNFFAHLLNRTHITADANIVRIQHKPLPWPGNRTIQLHRIKRLEVPPPTSFTGGGSGSRTRGTPHYTVCYYNTIGLQQPLVNSGFINEAQANYIREQLEVFLQLPKYSGNNG